MNQEKVIHPRPRRRWWQHLVRFVVLGGMALATLYVTFPFWAPTGLIREHVRADLARQLGVDVQLQGLDISWSRGIVLEGLAIASDDTFERRPLAIVERMTAEYSPYNLLVHERMEWMTLDRPHLFARVDDKGNSNLAVLSRFPSSPQARRILVRNARADLFLPRRDCPLRLEVSDMQIRGGRTTRLGAVTVSAGLVQGCPSTQPATAAASAARPGVAPLSIKLAASPKEAYAAASAALAFRDVDLEQLNLPRLLGLPLRKLSGRCNGSVQLQINRQAIVDGFSLDLTVRRLDAQPLGDLQFPVIDEALVRVNGTFDLAVAGGEGKVEIQSASVRLPGLELAGNATLLADALGGNPEAIKALELKGVVYPERLAALIGYQPSAGEPALEGPVAVEASARRKGDRLAFRLLADAADCRIVRDGEPIKPPGRALRAEVAGDLDDAAEQVDVRALLGGNTFRAGGKIDLPRRLVRKWSMSRTLPERMRDLTALNLQGSAEIKDLPALLDLLPMARAACDGLKVAGPLLGQWSLQSTDAVRVRVNLRAPAGTAVSLKGVFEKPGAAAMSLDLSAVADPALPGLRDLDADLVLEQPDAQQRRQLSRASVNRARVVLQGTSGHPEIACAGRFDADKVEALRACVTAKKAAKAALSGSLHGQFDLTASLESQQGTITADMARLDAAWADLFHKPAGQDATVAANFRQQEGVLTTTAEADLGKARLTATAAFRLDGGGDHADLNCEIRDAGWALIACPALAQQLRDGEFRGPLSLKASGTMRDRLSEGKLEVTADEAEGRLPGPTPRLKPAGSPLRLTVEGQIAWPNAFQGPVWGVRNVTARFGGSELRISGTVRNKDLATPVWETLKQHKLPDEYSLDVKGLLAFDDALGKLLPELRPWVQRHGLSGGVTVWAQASGTDDECLAKAGADAKDVDFRNVPLAALTQPATAPSIAAKVFSKPRDTPAKVELELTLPGNLSQAVVRGLQAQIGPLYLLADGVIDLEPGRQWIPDNLDPRGFHVSISTRRADELGKLAPWLEPHALKGDAFFDVQWRHPKALPAELVSADLRIDELTGRWGGKDLRLSGEVGVGGVTATAAGYHFGHIRTDGLTFAVGPNAGILAAEVKDWPEKPSGQFDLQCSYLDDQDLTRWAAALDGTAPASGPATQVTALRPPGPGTAGTSKKEPPPADLLPKARVAMDALWAVLDQADIEGRISVDHLRTLDSSVHKVYDARYLNIRTRVKDAHLQVDLNAAVNGGDYRRQMDVVVRDAKPVVRLHSQVRDVLASESIQPQLAKYFPGNTVYGTFSRTEDLTLGLEDLVANAMDGRHAPRFTGKSITVTTDGLLEGRAAPKIIATIFPGLNLAKYRYDRMTAFAEMRADGSTANDMIFSGRQYDTYIEGATDANNYGQYEMGLILVGSPQSPELNHQYKLGRLLLLTIRARIEDGKLIDQQVSYPWPNEALGAFMIRNNPVYRLWVNPAK